MPYVNRETVCLPHVARMEDVRSALKMLTVPTRNRSLVSPRPIWEDINIRMNPKEVPIRGIPLIRLWIEIIGDPL